MANINPNDSILRTASLEQSTHTMNVAHRHARGRPVLPVAQRKAYAPPFVNHQNEFVAENVGRYLYFCNLVSIEKVAFGMVLFSLLCNVFAGVMVFVEDFSVNGTNAIAHRQFFYNVILILPLTAHYLGIKGVRQRKLGPSTLFLVYSVLEVTLALLFNSAIVRRSFFSNYCVINVVVAATLLGSLAFVQVVASYFVYEDICYLRRHVFRQQRRRRRPTELATITTMASASSTRPVRDANAEDGPLFVQPSAEIHDTLDQVRRTWQYQRRRRRRVQSQQRVHFDTVAEDQELDEEEDEFYSSDEEQQILDRSGYETVQLNGQRGIGLERLSFGRR